VACLPKQRYGRCYEPGCSIGELTKVLAARCDELLAIDCAMVAVQRARAATAELGYVRVEQAVLPAQLPAGSFGLIVLSEVLSYLAEDDVRALLDGMLPRLVMCRDVLAVTTRPQPRWENANKHRFLSACSELTRLVHREDEDFILDVFTRTAHGVHSPEAELPPASVRREPRRRRRESAAPTG
jgi:trans-aconitate methyltransferase